MDILPKLIACAFLFRTTRRPIGWIIDALTPSPAPFLTLSFFLLGELGLTSLLKLLPIFVYIHLQYTQINLNLNFTKLDRPTILHYIRSYNLQDHSPTISQMLTPIICGTAFITGWCVRDENTLLPIDTFISNLWSKPLTLVLIFLVVGACGRFMSYLLPLILLLYFSLFISVYHLSFTFLFIFLLIGLLTRQNQNDAPFLSFYLIETCLTVGTLFTTQPLNILFAIGSIGLLWQLTRINTIQEPVKPSPKIILPTVSNIQAD